MDLQRINKHKQSFDDICHYIEDDNGADKIEVWFARELQIILGYARWENFQVALTRAVESCKTQNINIDETAYLLRASSTSCHENGYFG